MGRARASERFFTRHLPPNNTVRALLLTPNARFPARLPPSAGQDSTPKQQDGYFAAFGPPNPLTLDPYLAAAPAPPPGLGPPFQPSPSPSTFPFPSAAPGRAPPTRMASDASAHRTLDGSMAALALDSGSGGGANDGSPGGSSGGSSSAFTFDGRSSPASKDAALELLSRKVIQVCVLPAPRRP